LKLANKRVKNYYGLTQKIEFNAPQQP